jgi:hypothetical protein
MLVLPATAISYVSVFEMKAWMNRFDGSCRGDARPSAVQVLHAARDYDCVELWPLSVSS